MNRSHTYINRHTSEQVSKKIAIHEAGHAAAIYLGNKQKQLPPVFFRILINSFANIGTDSSYDFNNACNAQIEGGRLIHTLPSSLEDATQTFSLQEKLAYIKAFEADITNILVGPLAEARYIALCDNEIINPRLVNMQALRFYGGTTDLKIVNEYLDCFASDIKQRKISKLFLDAFRFVCKPANWRAISLLANYIHGQNKKVLECNEIIDILETGVCPPAPAFFFSMPE
jgi:hypothetical protein